MLNSLSIKNYALIENLKVDFQNGLSMITGETGAGKSILLGGLSLVLGKRADASLVKNKEKKCVIEAEFEIVNYNLKNFFIEEDLDFESITTIRREILPNGKSRAFINDTPTNLSTLNVLSSQLIDIHSQHETLQLSDSSYQFFVIDSLAGNKEHLENYRFKLNSLRKLKKELDLMINKQQREKNELEFNKFLFEELKVVDLKEDEQDNLEELLDKLSNVEEIKLNLSEAVNVIEDDQMGVRNSLNQVKYNIERIANYAVTYQKFSERINSIFIELIDLVEEFENENEAIVYNPHELEKVNERLQIIYNLQKKHTVKSISGLLELQDSLEKKIDQIVQVSDEIEIKQSEIEKLKNEIEEVAVVLHQKRIDTIPVFIDKLEDVLRKLQMKNTQLKINLIKSDDFLINGKDQLEFLISADKGVSFESLKKAASGGEISRIMLSIKSILSKYTNLPSIIFDEIDTGVSGEVSNKIAQLMHEMSKNMQVISITHLPQIAAKGDQHFKVYKQDIKGQISSKIKELDEGERVVELAEMLGGKDLTDSAIAHAKQLLN